MRLLAEMKLNKEFLVDQHITYLNILKNKTVRELLNERYLRYRNF